MSDYRCKQHPTLHVLVFTDGSVMVPKNHSAKAHLTKGHNLRGYLRVKINGEHHFIHRLVVETFIGPILNGMEVDHINRKRDDNRLENLHITSHSENMRNTEAYDNVEKTLGVHYCDGRRAYDREVRRRNPEYAERERERCREYRNRKKHEGK